MRRGCAWPWARQGKARLPGVGGSAAHHKACSPPPAGGPWPDPEVSLLPALPERRALGLPLPDSAPPKAKEELKGVENWEGGGAPAQTDCGAAGRGEEARAGPAGLARRRRRRRRLLGFVSLGRGKACLPAGRALLSPPPLMEKLVALALQLLGAWFSLVFLLIVLPSLFGVSLGISELYLRALVKTWEWAALRIQKGIRRQQNEVVKPSASNVIIQRDHTTMEEAIAGLHRGDFELSDVFYFCKKGFEAIVEDEVTQRFSSEELVSWNLLTRTNVNFHYISLRLTVVWVIGVFVRYCLLLPLRIALAAFGTNGMVIGTTLVGQLRNGPTKDWLSDIVHLTCSRILVRALSGNIYYHNRENKPQKGGICVANHTSPIDVIILANDGCYAMVGQSHGGLMGVIQRATVKASPHVWFDRSEMKDRHLVMKRLKEHIANKDKLPILIFPEGTCINNTSVMMFKKGSFEIGGTIYPVAIKYDPQFGDAFWNSSKYSIVSYLLRIMTSWAIVCHVWYLPPMTRKEEEDAVHFANRVKSAIALQGGLAELPWDGGLKRAKVKEVFKEEEQKNYSKMIIGNGATSSRAANLD